MTGANGSKNIYEMYVQNGNRCGFWVRRNSWSYNIAQITSIGGNQDGPLDGVAPYFKNQKVRGDVYHALSGKMAWASGGSGKDQEITSPGTYGYESIAAPVWSQEGR